MVSVTRDLSLPFRSLMHFLLRIVCTPILVLGFFAVLMVQNYTLKRNIVRGQKQPNGKGVSESSKETPVAEALQTHKPTVAQG